MTPLVAIKIDVDTHDGMRVGVPRLLDCLARNRLPGSFFLSLGPDRAGRAILQLRRPAFARKMLATNAPSLYGWRTILSGTLLPARPIATAFPDVVKRIEAEGHEAAVHAWDHRAWQDDLPNFKEHRIRLHLERAVAAFRQLTGHDPAGIGAPAWMTTPRSLALQDRLPFRYASDLRGGVPCRLRSSAGLHRLPQLPATGPCLEELLAGAGDGGDLVDALVRSLAAHAGPLRVVTLHAEVEGGPFMAEGERLLARVRELGEVVTMAEAATRLSTTDLPLREWCQVRLPGRAFAVTSSRVPRTWRLAQTT